MTEVTTLTPLVREAGELLRDAKANRLRSLVTVTERHDGQIVWNVTGDPPMNPEAVVLCLVSIAGRLLNDERSVEAE